MKIAFIRKERVDLALKKAPIVLQRNLRGSLETIGKRLKSSAQLRMRRDTGESQKSLKTQVSGQGLNLQLVVFSSLTQAVIDAYGLPKGIWPNSRVGSRLYRWVIRRMKGGPEAREKFKKLQAKKIKKGLIGKVPKRKKGKYVRSVRRSRIVPEARRLSASERSGLKNNDIRRLSFLVARNIFRFGIRPTHWNQKALEANKTRIVRELQNGLARAVNELNRG